MNKRGSIGIIIILIIVIAVGGGGYYYIDSGKVKIISTNPVDVNSCADSDGLDIYTRGSTTYTHLDPGDEDISRGTTSDWCNYHHPKTEDRIGLIREGYCENNKFIEQLSTCGRGFVCRNGACIEGSKESGICYDTDGGKTPDKRGEINGYGGSGLDDCWITFGSTDDPSTDGGYTDKCDENSAKEGKCFVYEYYCDGDQKQNEILPCSNGCINGACL